ncbi:TPA: DUF551 domain-containing protein [Escherichia coli]|nr:DUF551 domain-containing protein [Escherichia coli]HAX7228664.1 DUF551 domain-containing protein [Escherichia coli]HBB1449011.1 DUF551 domain-containing protein [Escherichia coli]
MSTITKERIELFIKSPLENGLTRGEQMELARIALASLEAKPIGAFHIAEQQVDGTSDYLKDGEWPIDNGIIEVYAAPPVPVVPEEKPMPNPLSMYTVDAVAAIAEVRGWNACRAAMLHGAEPVSQTYKLPVNTPCQDAPAHIWLQTAGVWPEDGELSELTWCSHNQHHDDTLYVRADLVNGNSPVTPDGWISCSERMPVIGELNWRTSFPLLVTCEIGVIPAYYGFVSVNGDRHYGFMESLKYGDDNGNHPQTNEYGLISNVTHWMPLPEPPQEVK